MRILMMGTGPFAVPTFQSLLNDPAHEVIGLITRPPRGNRRKPPAPNPMEQVALDAGLRIEMPESIKSPESNQLLRDMNAELLVVCDYGQILSRENLSHAHRGGINLHASLLPAYRGAAPIHWAIYDGCQETGISVIHMTPRLDGGPLLAQTVVPIEPLETTEELEPRLAELGVPAVQDAIGLLASWDGESAIGTMQDASQVTKAPRLNKSDGNIDWTRTTEQIVNQFRAFQPWPGTFSHWIPENGGRALRVVLTHITAASRLASADTPPVPGTIIACDAHLQIATGDQAIEVLQIQPSGKKPMPIDAFLRGYRVQPGDRFGTPNELAD